MRNARPVSMPGAENRLRYLNKTYKTNSTIDSYDAPVPVIGQRTGPCAPARGRSTSAGRELTAIPIGTVMLSYIVFVAIQRLTAEI
ncbi:hypothetical protein [Sphingomonas sp. CLY1604]|uniref:hypothetical protein n=1 Tax=Sphingomonas sp. CLY1604 TaxID=3457786 RepID=UPI003FD809B1